MLTSRPRHPAAAGFTLIELLLVLSLIGVAISIATFSASQISSKAEEKRWQEKTLHELKRTRLLAIYRQTNITLRVDVKKGTLATNQTGTSDEKLIFKIPENFKYQSSQQNQDSPDIISITFRPDGSLTSISFSLLAPSGKSYTFRTLGMIGKVEVFENV